MCILRHSWKYSSECFTLPAACWKTDYSCSQSLQSQVPGILSPPAPPPPPPQFPGTESKNGILLTLAETFSHYKKLREYVWLVGWVFFMCVWRQVKFTIIHSTHPLWKTERSKGNHTNIRFIILVILCNTTDNPHCRMDAITSLLIFASILTGVYKKT